MPAQVKPLRETLAKTHKPSGTSSANPKEGNGFTQSPEPPHSIDNYTKVEHHSEHSSKRSKHYKEVVIGTTATGQFGDKAINKLNPTTAAPEVRTFPGLANG